MRLATWNVNSIKQRVPRLLPWLDQREPDVVCLQETKLADDAFTELLGRELVSRGYEVATHGEVQWNGVAILSRVGLEEVERGWPGHRDFRIRKPVQCRRSAAASGCIRCTCRMGGCPILTTTGTSWTGWPHSLSAFAVVRITPWSAAT